MSPGTYTLTARVTTPNDAVTSNDTRTASINIVPVVDVGMRPITGPQFVLVGTEFTVHEHGFHRQQPGVRGEGIHRIGHWHRSALGDEQRR